MALYNYPGAAPRIALIPTRGKEAVMNFPVLPGAPIYFLDETAPYIYVKTAGYPPFGGVTVETIPSQPVYGSQPIFTCGGNGYTGCGCAA